jgi:hypothetical protein
MSAVLEHTTTIRPLALDELPLCVPFAQAFHQELQLAGKMIPEVFVRNWEKFLTTIPSVILSLWKDDQLIGGLGAIIVEDLNDGRLCASEMFLFMNHEHRGGTGLLRLLRAYKRWAFEQGAVEARITHMNHPPTNEALDRLYRHLGGRLIEQYYSIPLREERICPS